jgi:tRNA threonylcarbamoyladenosine biosynthesis protein TsaB
MILFHKLALSMQKNLILQLETATAMCSVALAADGEVLAVKELNERNVHASQLTIFIDEVMKTAVKSYKDLNAISVSKGPGSYTGLRIGVSTAKGLCFALGIPLISVDTLEGMASGYLLTNTVTQNALLCPMIDARRMEVYTSVFDAQLNAVERVKAKILDASTFDQYLLENPMIFFGDGASKTQALYSGNENFRYVEFHNSAAHLSAISLQKLLNGETENLAYFEPFYLKDFIPGISSK